MRLLHNPAGDTSATATQRLWLVRIIVAACVDHDRPALDVGQFEVRHRDCSRGITTGINSERRHVPFVAFTARSEVFAGTGGIEMATSCKTCRRLFRPPRRPARNSG